MMGQWEEQLLQEAIKLHDAGVEGDKDAVVKAHDLLQKLRQPDQNDPLIEAYYGSTTTLLGRDALDPVERFNKVKAGLKILDRAVANFPEHVMVRILRAYVSYRLPEEFFHRTKIAVEDFQFLKVAYEQDQGILPQKTYWQILYDLGEAYRRIGDNKAAEDIWTALLGKITDHRYKAIIQAKLKN